MGPRFSAGLGLGLVLYVSLSVFSAREVGFVGETDIGWALAEPPTVLAAFPEPDGAVAVTTCDSGERGPLLACATRPLESVTLGGLGRWPLAVNAYTGGVSDWPARIAVMLTGTRGAGVALSLGLGALLLVLAHRFLRFHGTPTAAGAVALLLGSDWVFVFFKRVLGGTEILLQTAGLLVLWSLWSRRWKGGRHGSIAIALGVGLGLHAKATFGVTLLAFGLAALLTRWDHPRLRPPERVHLGLLVGLPALCLAPLALSLAHHATLPEGGLPVPSHDTLSLQFARLLNPGSMGRESWINLGRFLGCPLGWLGDAWRTVPVAAFDPLRALGFGVALLGAAMEWRDRTSSPAAALLRFLSMAVPIQLLALFLVNRDLHHLAQATVPLALFVALGADRVAATLAPPRSFFRALATGIFCLPLVYSGAATLLATDSVVRTARAHLFSADGQQALAELIRAEGVTRLVTTSYETCGMLDQLLPGVEVVHAWGAVARGDRDVDGLRRAAAGGHYLRVRGSAPFVYDWRAEGVGTFVAAIGDGQQEWAELYRVDAPANESGSR